MAQLYSKPNNLFMTFCELHLDYVLLGTPHCIIVNEVNKIIYPEKMNKKLSSLRKQYQSTKLSYPGYHITIVLARMKLYTFSFIKIIRSSK